MFDVTKGLVVTNCNAIWAGSRPRELAGEDDPVPSAARLEPGADDLLGAPLRLGPCRNRISLCGIEEIDPAIDRHVHLGMAVGFGVLLAPCQGAQA